MKTNQCGFARRKNIKTTLNKYKANQSVFTQSVIGGVYITCDLQCKVYFII